MTMLITHEFTMMNKILENNTLGILFYLRKDVMYYVTSHSHNRNLFFNPITFFVAIRGRVYITLIKVDLLNQCLCHVFSLSAALAESP